MSTSLITTPIVHDYCRILAESGCEVDRDDQAGTVVARDGDTVVFRAIQKGYRQPWIARFTNSDRISWGADETAATDRELGGVSGPGREHAGDAQGDGVSVPAG